ncbi:hypothetical protein BC936DRAFT_138648 [Jimgerdemannia flammicorona]|uniref:Uncharacterized protein n=1 Tax=Jimgerdemannia flammicorona TaxID=994334 RepID=A0A433DI74_9FUNG|nr:hypothetical protein BC936DRAFT_138648 [Jimgerdemannia flammicorona]
MRALLTLRAPPGVRAPSLLFYLFIYFGDRRFGHRPLRLDEGLVNTQRIAFLFNQFQPAALHLLFVDAWYLQTAWFATDALSISLVQFDAWLSYCLTMLKLGAALTTK